MKKGKIFWSISFLLLISWLISSSKALADGGYVWEKTFIGQARSGGQQAIVLYFDGQETLVLQTGYEGELADFSWIIPVPSPITVGDVYEPYSYVYSWIDELTAPSFYIYEMKDTMSWWIWGCGGSSAGGGSDSTLASADRDNVEVLDTIFTDTYEINVLTASQTQDLFDWFDQNGYTYPPEAEDIFESYILRGWYFLAVRISPSNAGTEVDQTLEPLQISFEAIEPVFPLMISSLSSDPETEILIHFLSDHRFRTSNVISKEVDYSRYWTMGPTDDYKSDYQQWMKRQVENSNGELYFVEYASWLWYDDCLTLSSYLDGDPINCNEDVFVTRFRSYFSPDLFLDDIYFEQDANDNFLNVIIEIDIFKSQTSPFSLLASLFFLTAALMIRKRSSLHLGRAKK